MSKRHLLSEFPEKKWNDLFGTHAYRTKRPIPKIFSTNMCTVTPLICYDLLTPVAQLRSVQEEMDSLEEEKESELLEVQEELRAAQEEVLLQQQAAEEAAAERENDIASLQEELCRLRAEISRLDNTGQEYELEIVTLRAEIEMKSQSRLQQRKQGENRNTLKEL